MVALIERYFQLKENNTTIRTEVLAGLTTFSTMAYIIVVNPLILKEAGMDFGAVMVATILSAALATLIMAFASNYPFALASGMGLNAFFTYTLVIEQHIPWETALGVCFWTGVFFLLLNLVGLRSLILIAIPTSIRVCLTAGIGLFLAFIALSKVGVVVAHPETLVTVGKLGTPPILLACLGLLISTVLITLRINGALLIGILVIWAIALACGMTTWEGIVSMPPSLAPTFLKMDLMGAFEPAALGGIIAFTFIAIFDAAGSVTSMAQQAKLNDKDGKLPRAKRVFISDATGTMIGAALGTSLLTIFMESVAGVAAGGRTGLTAVVVALLFLLSLFFAPLVGSIPFYATAPALIIIGAQMLAPLHELELEDPTELIPGFLVLITIPMTFCISTGIAVGLITYPLLKLFTGRANEVHWLVWVMAALFAVHYGFASC